ncbi:MAG TPA: hypothetical protein VLF40_05180 [Candidatus Saccharimonadales bacterium]|nr:hypothetical protein [Candidatus Saccharimonadales bacterium]
MAHPKWRRKAGEWLRRYVPAEIIGTATAIVGALICYETTGSLVAAAVAGDIGEFIGYYTYFGVTDTARHFKRHKNHAPFKRVALTVFKTIRDMLVEFGPAELLDTMFVRPVFMYLGTQFFPNFVLGILAGKIASDIIFYAVAIMGYEFRKRRWA